MSESKAKVEAQRRALADFLIEIYRIAGREIPVEGWDAIKEANACANSIRLTLPVKGIMDV